MRGLIIVAALCAVAGAAEHIGPPEAYPPAGIGLANPVVTQENIRQTICAVGWIRAQRPSAEYTNKLKRQWLVSRHESVPMNSGEWDHDISIELGGHPTDPRNMWFELYSGRYGAKTKDQVEDKLHRMVCAAEDSMPLTVAQKCITSDWIRCGQQIGVIQK